MNVIHALGKASAADVHAGIPDPPSATAVRTLLRILEDKGHLTHTKEGARHIYRATRPRRETQRSAVRHTLRTFFGGSAKAAIAALLDAADRPLTQQERAELIELIERTRAEGG